MNFAFLESAGSTRDSDACVNRRLPPYTLLAAELPVTPIPIDVSGDEMLSQTAFADASRVATS